MVTKSMSIYLLKPDVGVKDALKEDHGYEEVHIIRGQIPGLRVFLKPGIPITPWWKNYLGIDESITQQSNSATAFVECGTRTMVLTFGSGQHLLKEEAYVHDFGTQVVLNAVDPNKLKSTDTLEPDSSQRRRVQIPFDGDLALLSFTGDSAVLKSLTGKAKTEHRDLVGSVTGAASLRVTTPAEPEDLPALLERLSQLYESEDYRKTFPNVRQIQPVTDPDIIKRLNSQLTAAVFDTSAPLVLTVPDILDYSTETYVQFKGRGVSEIFDDVYIKHYREYLESKGVTASTLTVNGLKHDTLCLLDGNDEVSKRWSILRSLVLEVQEEDGYSYHLSDGTWYRVATGLIESLRSFLNPYWIETNLPSHEWSEEAEYNIEASALTGSICLDKTNVSPHGKIEPCDLLRIDESGTEFIHVKIGTGSASLSHLFNQAANSMLLLRTDQAAVDKLAKLLHQKSDDETSKHVVDSLNNEKCRVAIAIISHKRTPERKSDNIPIFSRISLRNALTTLKAMGVTATVQLVPDATDRAGRKRTRKSRQPN